MSDLRVALAGTPKRIPCAYLYDARGSQLFEDITELPEYYLYREEAQLLERHARSIAAQLPQHGILVELGCGCATKTGTLLQAVSDRCGEKEVSYVGIDVSQDALDVARQNLQRVVPSACVQLVQAEYLEGLAAAREMYPGRPLCLLWLGSSIGNFSHEDAAAFVRQMVQVVGQDSKLLLCTDQWKDEATLLAAYSDASGVTEAFIRNAMAVALRTLEHPAAGDDALWAYRATANHRLQQVEMWLVAQQRIPGLLSRGEDSAGSVAVEAGEAVLVEISRKFSQRGMAALALSAGMHVQEEWGNHMYRMQLLLPLGGALRRCWSDTQSLFDALPEADWMLDPISLRHPFCFYYGHVAAFAKRLLLPEVVPSELDKCLQRGMDPIVDDPKRCHPHSPRPPCWPKPQELRAYVDQAHELLAGAVESGRCPARMAAMALEHELMHQETLAYMLAQRTKQRFLAAQQDASRTANVACNGVCKQPCVVPAVPHPTAANGRPRAACIMGKENVHDGNATNGCTGANCSGGNAVYVAGGSVVLGCCAAEAAGFQWDNEVGQCAAQVGDLWVDRRPVTVGDFHSFVADGGYRSPKLWQPRAWRHVAASGWTCPATWSLHDGQAVVHSERSSQPWAKVCEEPVYCSLAEAQAYCAWRGEGWRVMSEAEWCHLALHAQARVEALDGGGWEWTSTPFASFTGFAPDPAYPEYSTDFFDGNHHVLRGCSPASPAPMRARARDFRNFYQQLYPYAFAKFRCVRDA